MGERAKSIGEEAESKVWNFLDDLGYDTLETNNEEYDIDSIAEPPPYTPDYGLALPPFAPKKLTAFEVTERNSSEKKIKKFRRKILKYNRENHATKLAGGIYLVDRRISQKIQQYMLTREIYGWGVRRQRLYREKIRVFNSWKEKGSFTREIPVDNKCSYILVSTPPPTDFDKLLHIYVYFDEPYSKLTPLRLRTVMKIIKEKSINRLLEIGIKPITIEIEFYSNGGLSKRLLAEFKKKIVTQWNEENVSIELGNIPFQDYRAFTTL